jgi:hypothetical protein
MEAECLYTHKGWFGVCPIYLADTYTDGPTLIERRPLFRPLMLLSELGFSLAMTTLDLMGDESERLFLLRITGELDPPISDRDLPRM